VASFSRADREVCTTATILSAGSPLVTPVVEV
jgi:hypothetical protein